MNNQISKKTRFICDKIGYHHDDECFLKDIGRVMEVFPKFKQDEQFYYFEKFHELHNRIQFDKWGINELEGGRGGVGSNQNKNKNKNKTLSVSNDFLPYYRDLYKTKRGSEYVVSWGKDNKIINQLLEFVPLDELKMLSIAFFNSNDPFIAQSDYSIALFKSQINKLRSIKKPIARGEVR